MVSVGIVAMHLTYPAPAPIFLQPFCEEALMIRYIFRITDAYFLFPQRMLAYGSTEQPPRSPRHDLLLCHFLRLQRAWTRFLQIMGTTPRLPSPPWSWNGS